MFFFFQSKISSVHFLGDFVTLWWWTLGHDCACHGTGDDDARTARLITPTSARTFNTRYGWKLHTRALVQIMGAPSARYFLVSPSDDKPNPVFDVEDA